MITVSVFVGIDVSKDRLDVALRPSGDRWAVAMSCPISRRSSGCRAFSQSRTGSVPAGVW